MTQQHHVTSFYWELVILHNNICCGCKNKAAKVLNCVYNLGHELLIQFVIRVIHKNKTKQITGFDAQ